MGHSSRGLAAQRRAVSLRFRFSCVWFVSSDSCTRALHSVHWSALLCFCSTARSFVSHIFLSEPPDKTIAFLRFHIPCHRRETSDGRERERERGVRGYNDNWVNLKRSVSCVT